LKYIYVEREMPVILLCPMGTTILDKLSSGPLHSWLLSRASAEDPNPSFGRF
jgi:hypothetical protein